MSSGDIANTGPMGQNVAAAFGSPESSPDTIEMAADIGGMSLDDGERTPTQGQYTRVAQGSSGSEGVATPTQTPAQLAVPGSGLIRKSASSMTLHALADDDVFGPVAESTSDAQSTQGSITAEETVSDRIRAGHLCIVPDSAYRSYAPRPDRGTEVTAQNVQGIWPAEAVVFVANLSAQRTVEQLMNTCHGIFDVFGRNVIKVKFDKNKHPFALVQFETVASALEAIRINQGTVLDNRTIRLEQGKAERAVIITANDGTPFPESDARQLLEQFGAIDAFYPTNALRGYNATLPGFYVRFVYYQDCRDALKTISGTESNWRLQLAGTAVEEIRQTTVYPPYVPRHHAVSRVPQAPQAYANTDTKSVFIGNLPIGTTKQQLVDLFAVHGQIVDVNVITKRYEQGSINVFGFVEFSSGAAAEEAAYSNEKWMGGKKLRIEPKEYTARRGNRINQGVPAINPTPERSPRRTPRRITPQATNALSTRLAANNVENFGSIYTPGPTPGHLLPAHLFSPSPPNYYGMQGDYGYGGGYSGGYGGYGGGQGM